SNAGDFPMLFGLLTKARCPSSTPSRRAANRPSLEVLEDRDLLSAGALDPTFGSGGIVTTQLVSTGGYRNAIANALTIQSDGKVVAAGSAQTNKNTVSQALVRYTPAGGLDTSFGGTGKVVT